MSVHLVFSLLGADRTGLVDRLSGVVAGHGGNLEDARMSVLGGEFAVMMLVRVDDANRQGLERAMRDVAYDTHMMILAKETSVPHETSSRRPFTVRVTGADHEGIVHPLVNWLASQGCSIVDLESHVSPAPHTGTMLFSMTLHVEAASAVSTADVQRQLQAIADRLNVDVEVEGGSQPLSRTR